MIILHVDMWSLSMLPLLLFKVYEHEKFRNTLLAEVYLPIPHRNVLSSSAVVETLQFGSERRAGSSE